MKICFLPIDNRPVCYNLARDIANIDNSLELILPPRDYLGSLTTVADTEKLLEWLDGVQDCDALVISLDTLVYGGLIPSRRISSDLASLVEHVKKIHDVFVKKHAKIYAFSSIMRISNNNFNIEEKEYWSEYGKKIFKYSYDLHKYGKAESSDIPNEILNDYLETRKRNFEINKMYLEWQKEGIFNTLIFSKDDCAEYGMNVMEAETLEAMGGFTKTGADEIPLTLLARAIDKKIKVFVKYSEPECKTLISNYEDVSVEKSVLGQLELGGFSVVDNEADAEIILYVNNFCDKQGELVMGWDTNAFDKTFESPKKPYAAADIRFANGADNMFVASLINSLKTNGMKNFLGYAGWNTTANTLGSLLACVKVSYKANMYNLNAFKKLQIVRLLDDWAYQANVRGKIDKPCDISSMMKPYETELSNLFEYQIRACYSYPWNRTFEIEVTLD